MVPSSLYPLENLILLYAFDASNNPSSIPSSIPLYAYDFAINLLHDRQFETLCIAEYTACMSLIEAARRNAAAIGFLTSAAIGVPSLIGIADGATTAGVASSIETIVQRGQSPALPPDAGVSNAAFLHLGRDPQSMADAAQHVPNYSVLHRSAIHHAIEAMRNGEDPSSISQKLKELTDLAHRQIAIGALGFIVTSAVVEVSFDH